MDQRRMICRNSAIIIEADERENDYRAMRGKSTFKLACLLNIIFLLNVSLTSLILFFSVIVMAARPVLVISANISGIELKLLNTTRS